MSFEEVYSLFLVYSSLSSDKASEYSFFCTNAINYLRNELIDKSLEEENGWRLNVAASSLAYYEYLQVICSSNSVESFKAGDITINNKNNLSSAKDMWLSEKAKIASLLKDNEFIFKKV